MLHAFHLFLVSCGALAQLSQARLLNPYALWHEGTFLTTEPHHDKDTHQGLSGDESGLNSSSRARSSSKAPLPPGWTGHLDSESGRLFYHHEGKNLTQWERPQACTDAACSGFGVTADDDDSDGCACDCLEGYLGANCAKPPVLCNVPFVVDGNEKAHICPSRCPLLGLHPGEQCRYRCVAAEECMEPQTFHASFVDPEEKRCEQCEVLGCQQCHSSQNCKVCLPGLDKLGEQCVPLTYRFLVLSRYVLCGFALILVWYLLRLPMRPPVNAHVLWQALEHRVHARPSARLGEQLNWSTSLSSEISGVGIMLFFRFVHATMWACIFASPVLLALLRYDGNVSRHRPLTLEACGDFAVDLEDDFESRGRHALRAISTLYILSTLGAMVLACLQGRFLLVQQQRNQPNLQHFALLASGFPAEEAIGSDQCDKRLEDEYSVYFKMLLGYQPVIGVSLCWDLSKRRGSCSETPTPLILEHARRTVTKSMDRKLNIDDVPLDLDYDDDDDDDGGERKGNCCLADLRCLDGLLGVGRSFAAEPVGADEPSSARRRHDLDELLAELRTSGQCLLILNTVGDAEQILKHGVAEQLFREKHEIRFSPVPCDAGDALWDGFAYSAVDRVLRFVVALVYVGSPTVFCGALMAVLVFHIYSGPASSAGRRDAFLVGLCALTGNWVIHWASAAGAAFVRCQSVSARDSVHVVLYTAAAFVNTTVGLVLCITAASYQRAEPMSIEGVLRNPAEQAVASGHLLPFLLPVLLGTLAVEPLVLSVSHILGIWIVRSRRSCSLFDAEMRLTGPSFDLKRYGDVLVMLAVGGLCVFVLSVEAMRFLLPLLAASLASIILWERFRFFFLCSTKTHTSGRVDFVAQLLLAVPCAMLAACVCCRAFVLGLEPGQPMEIQEVWITCLMAGTLHLAVHCIIVCAMSCCSAGAKLECDAKITYEDLARDEPCNWFTSNPVHCLRSSSVYADSHRPAFTYYSPGKEYWQQTNDEICAYYKKTTFDRALEYSHSNGDFVYKEYHGSSFWTCMIRDRADLESRFRAGSLSMEASSEHGTLSSSLGAVSPRTPAAGGGGGFMGLMAGQSVRQRLTSIVSGNRRR